MDKNRETDGCGRDMPGEYREVSGRDMPGEYREAQRSAAYLLVTLR